MKFTESLANKLNEIFGSATFSDDMSEQEAIEVLNANKKVKESGITVPVVTAEIVETKDDIVEQVSIDHFASFKEVVNNDIQGIKNEVTELSSAIETSIGSLAKSLNDAMKQMSTEINQIKGLQNEVTDNTTIEMPIKGKGKQKNVKSEFMSSWLSTMVENN